MADIPDDQSIDVELRRYDSEQQRLSALQRGLRQAVGDDPFDPNEEGLIVGGGGELVGTDTPAQVPQQAILSQADQLDYITLLSQPSPPVTEMLSPLVGTYFLSGAYTAIYTNNGRLPIRLTVFVPSWGTPGEGLKLSIKADLSDAAKVDELSNSANGKSESIGIILKPQQTLFGSPTAGGLTVDTLVRTRIFDPLAFFTGIQG